MDVNELRLTQDLVKTWQCYMAELPSLTGKFLYTGWELFWNVPYNNLVYSILNFFHVSRMYLVFTEFYVISNGFILSSYFSCRDPCPFLSGLL
jgi:hypothetical protein